MNNAPTDSMTMTAERRDELLRRLGPRYAHEEVLAACQAAGSTVHVGGRSAFSARGCGRYGELRAAVRLLFGLPGEALPRALSAHDWGPRIYYFTPGLLPPELGMVRVERNGYSVLMSDRARALLEGLAVAPNEYQSLEEAGELMELLWCLHPDEVQPLLNACPDPRINRTFLYLAEATKCDWAGHIDHSGINLGEGVLEYCVDGMEEAEEFYFELHMTEKKKKLYENYQIWLPAGLGEYEVAMR